MFLPDAKDFKVSESELKAVKVAVQGRRLVRFLMSVLANEKSKHKRACITLDGRIPLPA